MASNKWLGGSGLHCMYDRIPPLPLLDGLCTPRVVGQDDLILPTTSAMVCDLRSLN
jgi:hypothetical protein